QPLTCTQSAGITITEPGPKSLAAAAFGPVYQVPLMIMFLISLLCEWRGLSVPAGTLRICVYGPVLRSPESTVNCMPFLSASSTHFKSANDTITGILLSCFCAASCAKIDTQSDAEISRIDSLRISALLFSCSTHDHKLFLDLTRHKIGGR